MPVAVKFTIHLHTAFHAPSSNISWISVIKQKTKYRVQPTAILLYSTKNTGLTKLTQFQDLI